MNREELEKAGWLRCIDDDFANGQSKETWVSGLAGSGVGLSFVLACAIEEYAEQARQEEREACARNADGMGYGIVGAAIRARSDSAEACKEEQT